MKTWSSIRAVYLLISFMLILSVTLGNWYIISFVAGMLQIGAWLKWCPSKWAFEKLGFRKSRL